MKQEWTIYVCPGCGETTLPPACIRWRCSECDTFFATSDERPEKRHESPEWWKRHERNYAQPGRPVQVCETPKAPASARHGTRSVYRNYNCRCEACVEANATYLREWRKRQPRERRAA